MNLKDTEETKRNRMQDPVTEWRQLQDAIEFAIQNNPLAACRNTPAYQARHEKELLQSFADRHAL